MKLKGRNVSFVGGQRWAQNAMAIFFLGTGGLVVTPAATGAEALDADDKRFQQEKEALAARWEQINQVIREAVPGAPAVTAPGWATEFVNDRFKGDDTVMTTRMRDRQEMDLLDDAATLVGGPEGVKGLFSAAAQAKKTLQQFAVEGKLPLNRNEEPFGVTNLRAGEVSDTSTDAINGSQLAASNERIGKLDTQVGELAARANIDDADVDAVQQSLTRVEEVADQATASVVEVKSEVRGMQRQVSGAIQVNGGASSAPEATGTDSVAVGSGARAAGEGSVAAGARAVAEGKNTSAVGTNARAAADNSVAVGANSIAEHANTVSVGRQGLQRQITHVGAGTRDTDAVNVAQLSRATAFATEQAHRYTDQRYSQLRHDLKQQDSTLSAGIAGAMAMANLPRSTVAGGSMTSVAVGNYRGESALAVGVSYVSESGRWSSNFMGSTNSRNDTGAAVGVGYQW